MFWGTLALLLAQYRRSRQYAVTRQVYACVKKIQRWSAICLLKLKASESEGKSAERACVRDHQVRSAPAEPRTAAGARGLLLLQISHPLQISRPLHPMPTPPPRI